MPGRCRSLVIYDKQNDLYTVGDELTDELTPRDLVYVLQHLDFGRRGVGTCPVWLDQGVRDYLVARIQSRAR